MSEMLLICAGVLILGMLFIIYLLAMKNYRQYRELDRSAGNATYWHKESVKWQKEYYLLRRSDAMSEDYDIHLSWDMYGEDNIAEKPK